MKHTKRLTSAILALLMVFTMLVPAAMIPAVAETNLDSALLFHYDFEETGDGVYANKASRESEASKDALILSSTDSKAFTVADGVVTANWESSAMRVNASENTKAIQTAENSTWFFRFMVPELTSETNSGKEVVIDFRHFQETRPLWIGVTTKTYTPDIQINGGTKASQVGTTGHDWTPNEWMNLAVVREGTKNTVYYISNDGTTVTRMYTYTAETVAAESFGFAFFRQWEEKDSKWSTYTYGKGMSYDDIRCYTAALSVDDLKGIMMDDFVEAPDQPEVNLDLLFHYDFEETGDGVYANKAYRENGASKDALILSTTDSKAFTVADGVVTANWDSSAMRVDASENTKAIQSAENSTWFFRFMVPELTSETNSGKEVVIDFRNRTSGSTRPLFIGIITKTYTPDIQINGSTRASQVGTTGHDWTPTEWMNLAVVREGTKNTVYYISNDGTTVTRMYTYTGTTVTAENFGFSFFREWNEANTKYETYTYAKGMSYDDIRCYTKALSVDDLKNIILDEFAEEAPADVITRGAQKSLDGSKVRLVAEIKGYEYKAAGFLVTASWTGKTTADSIDLACNFAYTSLLAEETSGDLTAITPTNEGYYLIAVVVENIPTDKEDLKLTFTPYTVSLDGTVTLEGEVMEYDHATGISSNKGGN